MTILGQSEKNDKDAMIRMAAKLAKDHLNNSAYRVPGIDIAYANYWKVYSAGADPTESGYELVRVVCKHLNDL